MVPQSFCVATHLDQLARVCQDVSGMHEGEQVISRLLVG